MLRYLTAGESHGQALVVIIEGLPAGLHLTVDDIEPELARRRLGYGRGPRQRFEQDELTLVGGVRHGRTLGSPLAIEIKNSEWFRSDKWHEEMSPAPGAASGIGLAMAQRFAAGGYRVAIADLRGAAAEARAGLRARRARQNASPARTHA